MYFRISTFLLFLSFFAQAQNKTIVAGIVTDSQTKEPIEYATIQFGGGSMGVSTDQYGRFLLESTTAKTSLKISFVGYETQVVTIKPNEKNDLKIALRSVESVLKEVMVRPEKYKKKNPAVDLVHEVFLHKDQNRKEGLPYYQFDTHEKLRFEFNGITEKYTKKWYFRPFQYAFTFCDTNKVNQKVTFPFYLRERLLTSFYRQDPFSKKDKLWAERQTAFEDDYNLDKDGISTYINNMYSEVDIYAPSVTLLNKQFIGPLSASATTFYRFYITDTIKMDNQRYASLFFSPINKNDLAFVGTMLVALDGTYAVREVDMGISKDININWISEIKIKQTFDFQGDSTNRRLLLNKDELIFDFKILKNKEGRSLLVTKKNDYQKYALNQAQSDTLYKGKIQLLKDTGNLEKTPTYWTAHRRDSLSPKEVAIKTMLDSIKRMRLVKNITAFGMFMGSGYANLGPVQLGSLPNIVRENEVEGVRLQLNARSSDRYFKKFRIRAYTAYGLKDKAWKYGGNTTIAFKGARPGRFPLNQMKLSFEHDLFLPGIATNAQNTFQSLQSGLNNRLLQTEIVRAEYFKEYKNNFLYSFNTLRKVVNEAGVIDENNQNVDKKVITTEVGVWLRYSPNARFYQTNERRQAIRSRFPVFDLYYKASLKGVLGGQYAYQRASLRMDKIFYVAPFGKTRCMIEGGKIFGQVPYQFLEIHPANKSYFFEETGFNLMNYLEFVSDQYAMLHLNHEFEGLILNRVPLLKKLHLREGVTFKALYGSLNQRNIPTADNGLIPFPVDKNKVALTQGLGKKPYMEASVGVGNILGFLRVDYIWRLSYTDLPNVQPNGIKLLFSAEF
jgi:Family of unknown function (DUF5686)/CarboxypepD_reg-like domain